jgi:hypothetical protein
MKRFGSIGLIIMILTLSAAQCGSGGQSTATENNNRTGPVDQTDQADQTDQSDRSAIAQAASAEEIVAESAEETAAEESAVETAVDTAPEPAQTEPEPAAVKDEPEAVCDDPFAGVSNVRFAPEVWTAEQLAKFVGSDLIDPASGLETNFCIRSIDYAEILSGGPPPDGIPPLDDPSFDPIETGDEWLEDVQPVIALAVGDEVKAYPLAVLTRHEIINDEIGGVPVAVTFCPLCNAAIVFKREVDGQTLRFGVSGNLRNSDLIMWDAQTLSWWQQFTGKAIVGELTGVQLEMIPAPVVAWKDFKAAFPDGQVVSGGGRGYGTNPYIGYDSAERPALYLGTLDPRLPALSRVLGYFNARTAVAYPLSILREQGVVEDSIERLGDVVIFYEPGQVSVLDQSIIANSKEVGSAHMYLPEVDNRKLTFSYNNGIITDNATGSEWDIFGRAVSGELEGVQLEPVLSHPHFWFAWAAFRPETRIYGE